MTDARLPERWLNDRRLQRLSAEHYRTYVNALLWSVANRTDGRIERGDVSLIPHWAAGAAKAFVDAGLFSPQPDGWLVADWVATQTSRDELTALEEARARERQKKARWRAKSGKGAKGNAPTETDAETAVEETCPRDGPVDVSRGPHRQAGRTGRQAGRRGQAGDQPTNENDHPDATDGHSPDAVEWPAWRGSGPDPFEEYA